MNGWGILLIIVSLIAALLSVWVRIRIVAAPEARVFLRVCFFTFPIYPKKEKRVRRMKAWPKEKTKKVKKEKKKKAAADQNAGDGKKKGISSALFTVRRVIAVLRVFFAKFPQHLHVDLRHLTVAVASPDAAKTAIEYGLVSQALAYLAELIDRHSHLHIGKKSEVSVYADFLSQKSTVHIDITLRIRLLHILTLAIHSALAFLRTEDTRTKTDASPKPSGGQSGGAQTKAPQTKAPQTGVRQQAAAE
ncbi:MAG: DUF2953 domain-containing protein [Ruminococcaceae bacterium]|nr:DUF2953 domain-containing protein [Oscillospiraceae bacterium]